LIERLFEARNAEPVGSLTVRKVGFSPLLENE
jgi:hypothetical protein